MNHFFPQHSSMHIQIIKCDNASRVLYLAEDTMSFDAKMTLEMSSFHYRKASSRGAYGHDPV